MPSLIDEAGHTKAFDYPVTEHWGGGTDVHVTSQLATCFRSVMVLWL